MRGTLMRMFTEQQHQNILKEFENDIEAAEVYTKTLNIEGKVVSRQVVQYWRKIFIDNAGKLAAADRELKQERVLIKPQPDDDFGSIKFIPDVAECILVIPDQHAPYQHPDFLRFLCTVRNAFGPDLVVNLGDETDGHALSFHDSDPNLDSAGVELEKAKAFLSELHREFPQMLICHSNHGSLVYRRAKAHGIPVQMIKKYRDILFPESGCPEWSWASHWRVNTPLGEVMFKHQTSGLLSDAAHNSCNLVVGHEHGKFDIEYSASSSQLYWGMHCGCGIDKDSHAFAYGKNSLRKPIIGCGMIVNGRPMLLPMVMDKAGRWVGRL